eukprot:CAMPEP_0205919096 /NCGR_PEP_ID=MMETSP1325-20131115/10222_1 /ASSEMBLY_ACC=CAM_ASM_000708 /TAXON_ID=236786 /ORGANISM="Florenciella sp., Strain RCC1007" /LENGTH=182 /DNA_ID=CAMNT_0053286677 /DNA_START=29 /DNA_END=577 /DNA_ORIENTATION=+
MDVEAGGSQSPIHGEAPKETAETPSQEGAPTKKENMFVNHVLPACAAPYSLVCGFQNLTTCPGIPGLAAFLITFAFVQLLMAAFGFGFQIPKDPKQAKLHPNQKAVAVSQLLGIVQVAVAIWGACISFPTGFSGGFPDGGDDCNETLFVISFLTSAITTGIVSLIILGLVGYSVYNGRCPDS